MGDRAAGGARRDREACSRTSTPVPRTAICCGAQLQPANRRGHTLLRAYDPQHGAELWKSDGTAAGTALVVDTSRGEPYVDGSYPADITAVGATVFFEV